MGCCAPYSQSACTKMVRSMFNDTGLHPVARSAIEGKEEPTHHNNQFNYHRYHNASRPPGDRHHNKRHKHPGLDHLQPTRPVLSGSRPAGHPFRHELPCRLVATKCGRLSSNPSSKIDTRLAVSCDASATFYLWPTKSRHCPSKPSLPPRLRSDSGYACHLASSLA